MHAVWPPPKPAKAAPPGSTKPKAAAETPAYRSPFMVLMLEAEKDLGAAVTEMKINDVRQRIKELGEQAGLELSGNDIKAMATLLRHPNQKAGGGPKQRVSPSAQKRPKSKKG